MRNCFTLSFIHYQGAFACFDGGFDEWRRIFKKYNPILPIIVLMFTH